MSNNPQRSFSAGELAPALFARADLARYAIGLRTCRNMVVMRAGGATKRPGTQFVNTAGIASAYVLTVAPTEQVTVGQSVAFTATLTDFLGNPITAFSCTFETDDATKATITATGPRTATIAGLAGGSTNVRARIAALGVVSNNSLVTVADYYIVHAFTANAALNVTRGGTADRIIMGAGGGSGGSVDGTGVGSGGGGAGEFLRLDAPVLAAGVHAIVIGAAGLRLHADHTLGGGYAVQPGQNGGDTIAFGRTTKGGGGGGGPNIPLGTSGARNGSAGGSGGGGGSCGDGTQGAAGGSIADLIDTPNGQGSSGGAGVNDSTQPGGGGGGAGNPGNTNGPGTGGDGKTDDITLPGTPATYCKGGDGSSGANGAPSTGNGGCGQVQGLNHDGGNGGSGFLYVRYRASSGIQASGGTVITFPV